MEEHHVVDDVDDVVVVDDVIVVDDEDADFDAFTPLSLSSSSFLLLILNVVTTGQ